MEKQAVLGIGTAIKAGAKAFGLRQGGVMSKINSFQKETIHNLAKKHKYKGNMGGMLTTRRGGFANGLSNTGKIVGGMGTAGATGYTVG